MQKVTITKIKELAAISSVQNTLWHFHLLTPQCQLNTYQKFALVLEDGTNKENFVYLSDEKPMEIGKELLELLHGKDVLHKEDKELGKVSEKVLEMIQRAKELNYNGFFWHHHVLFPYCIYNKHQGKWTILLEDPQKQVVLESITDVEPKRDLKEIEPAFYNQDVFIKKP